MAEEIKRETWYAAVLCYPINGRCVIANQPAAAPHYRTSRALVINDALMELEDQEPHEDLRQAHNLLMMNDRVRVGRIVVVIVSGPVPKVGIDGVESWSGVKVLNEGAL